MVSLPWGMMFQASYQPTWCHHDIFLHYWPFQALWGESTTQWWMSPHKGPEMGSFDVFFVVSQEWLNKQLKFLMILRARDPYVALLYYFGFIVVV